QQDARGAAPGARSQDALPQARGVRGRQHAARRHGERRVTMTEGTSLVSLEALAEPRRELLRAPASGQACVHWRLRGVEHLTAQTELVHDLASPEMFDLAWGGAPETGRAPVRIQLDPETARIEATPTLHRPGTPGAAAVARAFGFRGAVTVEEVIIRAGDEV